MPKRLSLKEQARRAHERESAEAERFRRETAFRLTPREHDVLVLAGRGLTYEESGKLLSISAETVKFHLKGARWLLDTHTTSDAVAVAIQRGLIPGRRASDRREVDAA